MISLDNLRRTVGLVEKPELTPAEVVSSISKYSCPQSAYHALKYYHSLFPLNKEQVQICVDVLLTETLPEDEELRPDEASYTLLALCNFKDLDHKQRKLLFEHSIHQPIKKPEKWFMSALSYFMYDTTEDYLNDRRDLAKSLLASSPMSPEMHTTLLWQLDTYWPLQTQ